MTPHDLLWMTENEGDAEVSKAVTRTDEVSPDIYRIATWVPEAGITFNQFLIDDESPALIHTGMHDLYEAVSGAVSDVLDAARLRFIALLHFEADECGGMNRFLTEAPSSTLVASAMSAGVNLSGWDYPGKVVGFSDGDVLDLGSHRLRFLETPHVHHWDSMMIFDESTASLFPADLYIQPGEQPPVVDEDLGDSMCSHYRDIGIFAHETPVRKVVDRLEDLSPKWIHPMHGGSLTRGSIPAFTRALRERPFAYEGRVLGRDVVTERGEEIPPS